MTFSPESADWTQAQGRRDNLCLPSVRPLLKRADQTSSTKQACFRGDEIRLDGRAFPERATCRPLFFAPQHFLESVFSNGLPVQSLRRLKDQQPWFQIPAHWFVPGYKQSLEFSVGCEANQSAGRESRSRLCCNREFFGECQMSSSFVIGRFQSSSHNKQWIHPQR